MVIDNIVQVSFYSPYNPLYFSPVCSTPLSLQVVRFLQLPPTLILISSGPSEAVELTLAV